MKNALVVILIFLCQSVYGQNRFGQFTISGGTTYSFYRGLHRVSFLEYKNKFQFTVGGQLHIDWGFLRRLSMGVGTTFHRHYLDISDYQYSNGAQLITEDVTQTIDVVGVYYRGLWHSLDTYKASVDAVDLYFGVQLMGIWARTSNNSTDPDFHSYEFWLEKIPGIVGGVRYYPTSWFGIHSEVAFPGPYTFSLGLAFRFGGRDKFFQRK